MLDALAEGDVGQVLVALSALLAGGWGPQQLATELVDDLRQVFLAALAPELCAASGPSLERFSSLAETMGLARVVRSMEILGHALVDMREAPDAQVVLEIAVVRAVRPDLDSGIEALSERVSVLERSLSGAAAFPRPGAPAGAGRRASPQPSSRRRPPAAAGSAPTAGRAPPPAGATWAAGRPSVRSGAASRAAAAPPAVAGRAGRTGRPGRAGRPATPAAPPQRPPPPRRSRRPRRGRRQRRRRPRQPDRGVGRRDPAGRCRRGPRRSSAAGRFVAVDEHGAHFALPNAAHRDRCAEPSPDRGGGARRALRRAGRPSSWRSTTTPPRRRRAPRGPAAPPTGSGAPPPEAGRGRGRRPRGLRGRRSGDEPTRPPTAEARLLEAFPGASEVAG